MKCVHTTIGIKYLKIVDSDKSSEQLPNGLISPEIIDTVRGLLDLKRSDNLSKPPKYPNLKNKIK